MEVPALSHPLLPLIRRFSPYTQQLLMATEPPAARKSTTAAERVMAIPELLEQILVHVPAEELHKLSVVHGLWMGPIWTSLQVQKAMFTKADLVSDPTDSVHFLFNPLLPIHEQADKFPDICPMVDIEKMQRHDKADTFWRNLYLTQPAVPKLKVWVFWSAPMRPQCGYQSIVVKDPQGVRMRSLCDLLGETPQSYFYSRPMAILPSVRMELQFRNAAMSPSDLADWESDNL